MFSVIKARLLFILVSLVFSSFALASPRVGNGGGAWVCRDADSLEIKWMKLTDLFEAEIEIGLSAERRGHKKTAWETYAKKRQLIKAYLPELQKLIEAHDVDLATVIRFTPAAGALAVINDGLYRVRPAANTCAGGYIYYAQIANFTNEGQLLVSRAFWSHPAFSERGRAALLLHELIYKVLRDAEGDRNSWRARQIVGLLFSSLKKEDVIQRVNHILASEPPPGEESSVEVFPVYLACRAKVVESTSKRESAVLVRLGNRLHARLSNFNFVVITNEDDGKPSHMEIEDLVSGSSSLFDAAQLSEATLRNQTVDLQLRTRNEGVATLTCWAEAREK